jgi:hypothetical protein
MDIREKNFVVKALSRLLVDRYTTSDIEAYIYSPLYEVVKFSENYWLMGDLFTSEITLIILPACYNKDIGNQEKNSALVLLVRFLTLPLVVPYVVFFIVVAVGEDILMMIGKLCKWFKGKMCNSANASISQVSPYTNGSENLFISNL